MEFCKNNVALAKQAGTILITGTFRGFTFYEMDGNFYVRRKSSLSGRRVKRSSGFKKTMQNAGLFGKAAKIAAAVYRALPKQNKTHGRYRSFVGETMDFLKQGSTEAEALIKLQELHGPARKQEQEITHIDNREIVNGLKHGKKYAL